MTKRGVGFLIVSALTLLAAFASGFSEIFVTAVIFGMVFAFALVSTIAGLFMLRAFHSVTPEKVVRGNKVRIEIRFQGLMLIPVVVHVMLHLPDGLTYSCTDMLIGYRHALTYDDFDCPHRGVWQTGISKIRCGDIFGFFSVPLLKRHMPSYPASVTVYPVLYELSGSPMPPSPSMEYTENNPVSSNQGDNFSDTRLYQTGDSLKRIHWKLTMRTHELHTRQYEMSTENVVVLVLDTCTNASLPTASALGYADMAAECCAALALYYISAGQKVKIVPSGDTSRSLWIRTKEEWQSAYTLFASIPFDGLSSLTGVLSSELENSSCICSLHIVTYEPSPEILTILSGLCSPYRQISLIYPLMEKPENGSDFPTVMPDGLRLIPILNPRDIAERLGGIR